MNSKRLRVAIPLAILCVAAVAYIAHFDFGTLSAFGWSTVSLVCPLGALATMLASKALIPRAVLALVVVTVLIVVFGRAFCGWICPVPVVGKLRNLFKTKSQGETNHVSELDNENADVVPLTGEEIESLKTSCGTCARKRGNVIDSRHIILGGTLLTAVIFGFPVFCLICPIGLTFATIFLVINLFSAGDMTWAVVLVPAVLLAEVVFFRKWCATFCPLSAFMSLVGKASRFFKPRIDDGACLETSKGKTCGICGEVCPEKIDPRHPAVSQSDMCECTRCRACVENCPANAITLVARPPRSASFDRQGKNNREG